MRTREFRDRLRRPFANTLQAYAQLFQCVEVNSTFYRIPRLNTAEKWRSDASEVRRDFAFTVKAYKGITHTRRFGTQAGDLFQATAEIAHALQAPLILLQSPATFHPTVANIAKMRTFFQDLDRGGVECVWEPRGKWIDEPQSLLEVCEQWDLVHCVDPFRSPPLWFGAAGVAYFRLHGFGRPSMYQYDFGRRELEELLQIVVSLPRRVRRIWVFFNNAACYENAIEFAGIIDHRLGRS